jgi:D-inositol-3-phosphate glycosyltransferase
MLKIAMVAGPSQLRKPTATSRTQPVVALSAALVSAGHEVTAHAGQGTALTAAVRSCRPDIVHAHRWSEDALLAARALDVPFVFSPHTFADGWERALPQGADHVLATFSAQRQRLVRAGVPRQNISVVPYGVDLGRFIPDGDRAHKPRPQLIIALGEMTPSSGFGTAVAALPALPDAELVLVSETKKGTHAAELRACARSLGVADRLRIIGPVPQVDLPAILRAADLMVCNPWEATFGMSALEGMACGLTVVASRIGGLMDTVVDKVTGVHVTPRKPRELAAALQRLLFHRSTREQFGAAGSDRATVRYSWARIATETLHAYRRAGAADPAVLAHEAAIAERKRTSRAASRL